MVIKRITQGFEETPECDLIHCLLRADLTSVVSAESSFVSLHGQVSQPAPHTPSTSSKIKVGSYICFYCYVFEKHDLLQRCIKLLFQKLDGFSSTLDLNTYQFFKNAF